MAEAKRDQNHVPTLLAVSNVDGVTPVVLWADPTTHRLLVDASGGSGTVTEVSVVTANGFAGTVADATTTPAITLTTSVTGILKGNGTAISAATAGTDYVTGSSSNTFTNKTFDTAGSGNSFSINGTAITAVTGTGSVVLATAPTFPTTITVGAAGGATGDILLKGTTSGTVTITTADAAGTWTLQLPANDGDSGQVLTTNGSGVTTWETPSGGGNTLDGAYDEGGAGAGRSITADSGAVEITVPDAANNAGVVINQNDVTNNPNALSVVNAGSGRSLYFESTSAGGSGPIMELYHNSASPAITDNTGLIFYAESDTGTKTTQSAIYSVWDTVTEGSEDGALELWATAAGAELNGGLKVTTTSGGVGILSSIGNQDLQLKTGNATTGTITITDGANGNITLAPNGNGVVDITSAALNLSTGENITVNNANPKKTIVLSAAGGWGSTTSGAAGPTKTEYTTNDVDLQLLAFDQSADEYAQWTMVMPDNYDGSTITAIFYWTAAAGSGTVAWNIEGRSYANDEAIDQAMGTAVEVVDTLIATGDVHVSDSTAAVTLGGTPAGGELVQIKVWRDVSDDTLNADALLIAVKLEYGISSYSD